MSRRKPASKRASTTTGRKPSAKAASRTRAKAKPPATPKLTRAKPGPKPATKRASARPVKRPAAAKSLMALGTGAYGGGLWAIIERVKRISGGDLRDACEVFEVQLDALDDGALVGTVREFDAAMNRAYDYGLWGAAYLIHGGCSDDTFWDFRTGLIALGKEIYEQALADPDSLADVEDVENRTLFEGFQYIPSRVIERRGLAVLRDGHMKQPPSGQNWRDEKELERRFPKLAARFN